MPDPRRINDNLLVVLYRLAHRQQENFATESFAHLLQHLIAGTADSCPYSQLACRHRSLLDSELPGTLGANARSCWRERHP